MIFILNQGAGKRPGSEKKEEKNESPEIRRSLQVPIYVSHDSEQKVEFKARIKPCSHRPNCMKCLV